MRKGRVIAQAGLLLVVVWGLVVAVRSFAGTQRITSTKIEKSIEKAAFADWSDGVPQGARPREREAKLVELAEMFNGLDYHEREKVRDQRIGEELFRRLAPEERERFVKLTVAKSMESLLRALDGMPVEERRRMVERGLRDIETGRTEEEMHRARELGETLLDQITAEGMRAYFEQTSADTKLDLAPLVEAMDGVLKGMKGHDFGPPR
ncbi:MAG: hypothetical protein ACQKBU_05280 [Verrucomicrobiales bacterium]